jgi:hypothetical protein
MYWVTNTNITAEIIDRMQGMYFFAIVFRLYSLKHISLIIRVKNITPIIFMTGGYPPSDRVKKMVGSMIFVIVVEQLIYK